VTPELEDDVIDAIAEFLDRTRRDRDSRYTRRLLDVYRATIGAPVTFGVQDKRAVAIRVTAALYRELRVSTGAVRKQRQRLLAALLAYECEEPAFLKLSWGRDEESAANRFEAVRFLAHLAAQVGAFGGTRAHDIEAQHDLLKKAKNKTHRNAQRRKTRKKKKG
jgi:hypothetical protein